MAKIVPLERNYCLWPKCMSRPSYEVYDDEGVSEGEFCGRHAEIFKRRLERDGEVDLYPTPSLRSGAMSAE